MIWAALDLQSKRRIVSWILAVTFLLLLAGCENDVESTAANMGETPIGTVLSDTAMETQRITAPDPDDDLNGPVYSVPPYVLEDDDPLSAEIQAALAEKKAKLIWAEDCFSETRHEAKIWRYSLIDCNELYEELIEELFPDATVEKREETLDGLRLALKSGQTSFGCMVDINGYYINFFQLPSGLGETLLPKTADWLSKRTGVEQREWTDFDPTITNGIKKYTACVDGVQVGALFHNHILVDLIDCHGVDVSNLGSLCLSLPISVGAEAGTVRLSDVFTQEELRDTLESRFNPNESTIVVYRSCEICYLIDEAKSLLVPVWWVKGVNFSTETGEGKPFEIIYDVETGSRYTT
jgi:hypothetical protein